MLMLALALSVAVASICTTALWWQRSEQEQERWRREFDAAQRPPLELAKVRADLDARLLDVEKQLRTAQLRKLA